MIQKLSTKLTQNFKKLPKKSKKDLRSGNKRLPKKSKKMIGGGNVIDRDSLEAKISDMIEFQITDDLKVFGKKKGNKDFIHSIGQVQIPDFRGKFYKLFLSLFDYITTMDKLIEKTNFNQVLFDPKDIDQSPLINDYATKSKQYITSKDLINRFLYPNIKTDHLIMPDFNQSMCIVVGKGNIEKEQIKGITFLGNNLADANKLIDEMLMTIQEPIIVVPADSVLFALDKTYADEPKHAESQKCNPYMYLALRALNFDKSVIFLYEGVDGGNLGGGAHRMINALKFLLTKDFYAQGKNREKDFNTLTQNLYYAFIPKGIRREDILNPICTGFANIGSFLSPFLIDGSEAFHVKNDPNITFEISIDTRLNEPYFLMSKEGGSIIPRPLIKFNKNNTYLNIDFKEGENYFIIQGTKEKIYFEVNSKQDEQTKPYLEITFDDKTKLRSLQYDNQTITKINIQGKSDKPKEGSQREIIYDTVKFDKEQIPIVLSAGAVDYLKLIEGKQFSTFIHKIEDQFKDQDLNILPTLQNYTSIYGSSFLYASTLGK